MRVHVVIAPDSFTGTLTAAQAAEAIAAGWRQTAPHDLVTLLPLSDGGPGFRCTAANSANNISAFAMCCRVTP